MKSLNIEKEEVAELLEVMGRGTANKVLEAVAKPQKEMAAQIKEGYKELAQENPDNHTHFEEIGEVDSETGERKLQFVRHPSRMSTEDHIQAIDNRLHRRRLARNARPRNTGGFERCLSDHIEEIQGHIRHLKLACSAGSTAVRCVADSLEDLSNDLGSIGGKITTELAPLSDLLGKLDQGQDAMDKIERLGSIVVKAVGIATNIPGGVGTVFKLVDKGMKPVHKILSTVDTKATQFENTVGKLWQNSVGRIDDLISSFDSGAVYYTTQGAATVASIQDSVCATSLVNELSGANLIGGVERAVDFVKNYIELLYDALKALGSALSSTAWKVISGALESIVSAVEPVRKYVAGDWLSTFFFASLFHLTLAQYLPQLF